MSARVIASGPFDSHNLKAVVVDYTFATPYVSGGETLTASNYGLSSILFVVAEVAYSGLYVPFYNPSTGKLQLANSPAGSDSAQSECSNNKAIGSSVTARLLIIGVPA